MAYKFNNNKFIKDKNSRILSIIQNKFNVYNNVQLNIVSPWNSGFKIVHK